LGGTPLWAGLLIICAFPALFEEIWFRGAIDKEYEKISAGKRAAITGLFFAAIHGNFHQAAYVFLFGVLCAYMLHYTQSILAPMLTHFANNSLNFFMYRSAAIMDGYLELWGNPAVYLPVMGGLSLAMLPVLIISLKKLSAYHKQNLPAAAAPREAEAAGPGKPKAFTWAFWLAMVVFAAYAGFIEIAARAGAFGG